jgi:MoxR-like ATPase
VTAAEVRELQRAVEDVYVDPLIQRWIVAVVRATRALPIVELGASVRGSLALDRAARAWALLGGREFVVPEDVEALFGPVLGHRILFAPSFIAAARRIGREEALDEFWRRCLDLAPRPAPARP